MESADSISNSFSCPCCGQHVESVAVLFDPTSSTITNGNVSIRLSRQQFKLAKFMIERFPMPVTKEAMYDDCFMTIHGDGPEMKIVDVVVCKIRPPLAELGFVIETMWGTGYRLVSADPKQANAVKEASIRVRAPGSMHMWRPEYDAKLIDLIGRKMKPAAIASIMRLPYMTVERNIKRLQLLS